MMEIYKENRAHLAALANELRDRWDKHNVAWMQRTKMAAGLVTGLKERGSVNPQFESLWGMTWGINAKPSAKGTDLCGYRLFDLPVMTKPERDSDPISQFLVERRVYMDDTIPLSMLGQGNGADRVDKHLFADCNRKFSKKGGQGDPDYH